MNGPFHDVRPLLALPDELEVLSPPPLLLPGEDVRQYGMMRQAVFADIAPQSALEWLLAVDVAEHSWEIRRYRMLRHKLLETFRQKAIETALRRVDMIGIVPAFEEEAEFYTIQNAMSWRTDPTATTEIEARLASYGFDQETINMEVYVQAREIFLLFEGLLGAAQSKRLLALREIKYHRTVCGKAGLKREKSSGRSDHV